LEMPPGKKERMRRAARERVEKHLRFSGQMEAYEAVLLGEVKVEQAGTCQ
jgi:hypothetical protein